jgi:hypothetical protein
MQCAWSRGADSRGWARAHPPGAVNHGAEAIDARAGGTSAGRRTNLHDLLDSGIAHDKARLAFSRNLPRQLRGVDAGLLTALMRTHLRVHEGSARYQPVKPTSSNRPKNVTISSWIIW